MSWQHVDLAPYVAGNVDQERPAMLDRADGQGLLYPGRLHWFSGEPESLKSWLAQVAVADALEDGLRATYLDFEATPQELVSRLRALGVSDTAMVEQLRYHAPMDAIAKDSLDLVIHAGHRPDISVIDGVNAAMGASGYDSNRDKDFYEWWSRLGHKVREMTPGPTIAIDHVVKNPDNRKRYASGTGQKLAAVDVHIGLEVIDEFGRGKTGRAKLVLHKDRPGYLRGIAEKHALGTLVLASDGRDIRFGIEPPGALDAGGFRPTELMQRVSEWLEANGPATKRQIRTQVTGMEKYLLVATDRLVAEGHVAADEGGAYVKFQHVRPFRVATDDKGDTDTGAKWCLRGAGHHFAEGGASGAISLRDSTSTPPLADTSPNSSSGANTGRCPSCGAVDYEPLHDGRLRCACGVVFPRAA